VKKVAVKKTAKRKAGRGLAAASGPPDVYCGWCGEVLTVACEGNGTDAQFHWECRIRMIAGSVAHLSRSCACYTPGAESADPPEISMRDAARKACRMFIADVRRHAFGRFRPDDLVFVSVHGESGASPATVLEARGDGTYLTVRFRNVPPFVRRYSGRSGVVEMSLHRESIQGSPCGPWIEDGRGGHYEVE